MHGFIWPQGVAVELDYFGVMTDELSAGTLLWQQAAHIQNVLKK